VLGIVGASWWQIRGAIRVKSKSGGSQGIEDLIQSQRNFEKFKKKHKV